MAGRKSPFFDTATTLGKIVAFFGVSSVCGVLAAGLLVPAAAFAGSSATAGIEFFEALPAELREEPLSVPSRIQAKDGSTIASFYAENRVPVTLDKVSENMRNAIVSIEDERFFQHNGVDMRGITRAAMHNLTSSTQQGASTLTQQYVNNTLINADSLRGVDKSDLTISGSKSIGDKLREAKLAIAVEKEFSKEEILQGYLNIVLFSGTTYGVEAAAQRFYSVPASELDIQQSAMLAGMVQLPNVFNPSTNPEASTKRRNVVLGAMKKTGAITDAEYREAVKSGLNLKEKQLKSGCISANSAAYFCDYVTHLVLSDPAYGKTPEDRTALLYRGGLTIKTTLDPRLQKEAEKETSAAIPGKDKSNLGTSIVSVQPGTGQILAMAQNKTYGPQDGTQYTEYNFNVESGMGGSGGFQGGSTMKPFTTLAWLESGKNMWDNVDARRDSYPDDYRWQASCLPKGYTRAVTDDGQWEVNNATDGFKRTMSVDYGLYWSINTATVAQAAQLDLCDIVDATERLRLVDGRTGETQTPTPAFVLGTTSVTPLAQAAAFAAFANKGEWCAPRALTSVSDAAGNSYKVPAEACSQEIDPQVVANLNGTLSKIAGERIAKGTMDMPIAGKTGTNNGASSTWFVGYSTGVSTAAWVGRNTGNKAIFGERINGEIYDYADSATFASPMWLAYMQDVSQYYPGEDFGTPDSRPSAPAPAPAPENNDQNNERNDNRNDDAGDAEEDNREAAAPVETSAPTAATAPAEASAPADDNSGPGNGRGNGNGGQGSTPEPPRQDGEDN
ncbi:transglycosylase domain-containing protein [Arthrobacter sp. KK5.5]|uniref:transglycosylase domain-containing protein n=1 Tax=Arthrobacter sp. KK5.5 TaxID=3373084 RepID=UPI003EE72771